MASIELCHVCIAAHGMSDRVTVHKRPMMISEAELYCCYNYAKKFENSTKPNVPYMLLSYVVVADHVQISSHSCTFKSDETRNLAYKKTLIFFFLM